MRSRRSLPRGMASTTETIRLSPTFRYAEELTEFCRLLEATLASTQDHEKLRRSLAALRESTLKCSRQPSLSELKHMLLTSLLLDLGAHGWTIRQADGAILLEAPQLSESDSPQTVKNRVRSRHLLERDAQLLEPSVHDFILASERRRLTSKGWHSIFSVMRNGEELANQLRESVQDATDLSAKQHPRVIEPYIQFVTPGAICTETGLPLNDIWRYFRHTWVNIYRSVPGRSVMVLVRDRAALGHPVIGIAGLGSSVVQQSVRDKWIGWDPDGAVSTLSALPRQRVLRWLSDQVRARLRALYTKDLFADHVLNQSDLKHPTDAAIARLRKESLRAISIHRMYPHAASHKKCTSVSAKAAWRSMALTPLFRSKRCKQLAILLSVRKTLNEVRLFRLRGKSFHDTLKTPRVQRALAQLVRMAKAERVGISMMDIIVCGAVAPYNALLGGKLICLLLCSPEVVQYYSARYRRQVSVIASAMKGEKVRRDPKLVLLCTTSLYGTGSSQYNRIKVPAIALGGSTSQPITYQELGSSEGFGSFHFSRETVRLADTFLGRSRNGRKVNSIFGEGVNPLMRKMREVLELLELPSDLLLRHGNKRIVYGIPLAENFRSFLLGLEHRPRYIIPRALGLRGTALLSDFWLKRWLFKRAAQPEVLQRVADNRLSYPIQHGAQVPLPSENNDSMFAKTVSAG